MRFILNVIWLAFAGFWLALGYLLAALVYFILIVTIPFGIASLRIASYALWPLGRTVLRRSDARGARRSATGDSHRWVDARRPA